MQITVGDYEYGVEFWDGNAVLTGPVLSLDTETEALVSGAPIVPVLLQVCSQQRQQIHLVPYYQMDEYVEKLFATNPDSVFVMHNAPFDLEVLGIRDKEFLQRAVSDEHVVDTGIRFMLTEMARGSYTERWALDFVAQRMLGLKVEKDDTLRLTFRRGMVLGDEHARYAAIDAAVTGQLFMAMPAPLPTENFQLIGFVALHFISRNGLLVDRSYLHTLKEKLTQELSAYEWMLHLWGWYSGEKGNNGVLQEILTYVEKDMDVKFPRTPKSREIAIGEELLASFEGDAPPFLIAYCKYKHIDKMINTYLKEELIGADGRVHSTFTPLVKTGRTSSRGPNVQNLPRKGGIRGIYVAPPGHVLYAADYAQLELCALAETCFIRFKHSTLRDVINSGEDVHMWLGKKIMEVSGGKPDDGTNWRQMAKAAGFGQSS